MTRPTTLRKIARDYRMLEIALGDLVGSVGSTQCAGCAKRCCEPDICREAFDSPWLARVRLARAAPHGGTRSSVETPGSAEAFDPIDGYLGPMGCRLRAGRPPVCYEFYCDSLLESFDATRQSALLVLGQMLTYVGRRALGQRHLVELSREEIARVRPERVARRIAIAHEALVVCADVFGEDDASPLGDGIGAELDRLRQVFRG